MKFNYLIQFWCWLKVIIKESFQLIDYVWITKKRSIFINSELISKLSKVNKNKFRIHLLML